jgi:RES domain-containing protein
MTLDGRISQCLEMVRSQRVGASILWAFRPYTLPEPLKAASWSRRTDFRSRFDPLTVCTYDLDIEEMVDLTTDPGRGTANVQLSELQCSWAEDMAAGKEPASWKVAKRLIGEGASGIIVPSFARGARPDMHNVVLWKWGSDLPHRVLVHDPSGRLPKNQLSWT